MRVLVVSDIHGNLEALRRVADRTFDQVLCLGDLVDYGPRPKECIDWVRSHSTATMRGNHDHALASEESCPRSARRPKRRSMILRFGNEIVTNPGASGSRATAIRGPRSP